MSNRTRRIRIAWAGGLLAATIGGVLTGLIAQYGHDRLSFWIMLSLLAAVLVASVAALLPWWRALDHMQRDGHLMSWYWGGTCAGGLALLVLLAAKGGQSEMVMGAALVWLAQTAGYLAALAGWRILHRSSAA